MVIPAVVVVVQETPAAKVVMVLEVPEMLEVVVAQRVVVLVVTVALLVAELVALVAVTVAARVMEVEVVPVPVEPRTRLLKVTIHSQPVQPVLETPPGPNRIPDTVLVLLIHKQDSNTERLIMVQMEIPNKNAGKFSRHFHIKFKIIFYIFRATSTRPTSSPLLSASA
jgi:hypothetical protein